ncbi:MAG: hypothetical protein ABSB40_08550 [Nitrososphaeria archaeon]|jgi:hypothetical protein
MSSIKARNVLLVTFVVLTIILGSLSAYEFFQVQQSKTAMWTSTSVITVTATVPYVLNESEIKFVYGTNYYIFAYERIADLPAGSSVTFRNVTFYSMPLNTSITGCGVYYIKIIFLDGTSERLNVGWCGFPTTSLAFTNHSNPKAGVFYAPGEYGLGGQVIDQPVAAGFYLLVSE